MALLSIFNSRSWREIQISDSLCSYASVSSAKGHTQGCHMERRGGLWKSCFGALILSVAMISVLTNHNGKERYSVLSHKDKHSASATYNFCLPMQQITFWAWPSTQEL